MPRPTVETRNCRVTLSENQIEQVETMMKHFGHSTLSEGLRYLITRGIQSELVTLAAVSNQRMSGDFARMVELLQEGVDLERTGKGASHA